MAHEISSEDFGYLNSAAWHGHPNYEVVDAISAQDVANIFDYQYLRAQPHVLIDGEWVPCEGRLAVVNSKTKRTVGIPTNQYRENQPQEVFPAIADVLINEGWEIVSVGTLQQTRKFYMSVRRPGELEFDYNGQQMVMPIMNIGDSVDSTTAFNIAQAQHRVVCMNTYTSNILGMPAWAKFYHSEDGQAQVANIAHNLEDSLAEQRLAMEAVERLIEVTFTNEQFMNIVRNEAILGERPTEEGHGQTRYDNRTEELVKAWHHETLDGIRNTAYGAIQAVQYWEQHVKQVRGATRQQRHLENLMGNGQPFTDKASELVLATID